ncbi:MAG: TonB family protein [Sphingobacteriaceae bacterium]|jgi:TonB family protein|nr:TonB family protein [Sphingobacteriaceae bacterium]
MANCRLKKPGSILILLFLFVFTATAQRQNVYYFKKNGQEVKNKDSANYIRIIREPDSGSVNYKLIEIGLDSILRTSGLVSEYYPKLVYEGVVVSYENGGKIQANTYEKGMLKGVSTYYYPNGNLKKTENHKGDGTYKLVDFYDSTGVKFVSAGNGYAKIDEIDFHEEGTYSYGIKTGKWKGWYKKSDSRFEEEYNQLGELLSGISVKSDVLYPYKKFEELPVFPGGPKGWLHFIQQYKYPSDARKAKVSGKITVAFVVEPNGSISDLRIVKGLWPSVDAEAIRLFQTSPNWVPGKQRGIPVRVSYTQSIALNIQ